MIYHHIYKISQLFFSASFCSLGSFLFSFTFPQFFKYSRSRSLLVIRVRHYINVTSKSDFRSSFFHGCLPDA